MNKNILITLLEEGFEVKILYHKKTGEEREMIIHLDDNMGKELAAAKEENSKGIIIKEGENFRHILFDSIISVILNMDE